MRQNKLAARAMLLSSLWFGAATAWADVMAFDYSEDFDNFGKTPNVCPASNPKGICAAVAAVNSFIFLENQYPLIYDNKLTPNIQGAKPNQTDPTDRDNFGVNGWKVDGNPMRQGYYPRPDGATGDYVATLTDWFNDYAPETTTISSFYVSSSNNGVPTIEYLASQINSQEDVELFLNGGTAGNHAITLTGVSCMDHNYTDCSITYQDPNSPTVNAMATIAATGPGGMLAIDTGYGNVYAAFSESPIPEPASGVLVGGPLVVLAWMLRKRRPSRIASH